MKSLKLALLITIYLLIPLSFMTAEKARAEKISPVFDYYSQYTELKFTNPTGAGKIKKKILNYFLKEAPSKANGPWSFIFRQEVNSLNYPITEGSFDFLVELLAIAESRFFSIERDYLLHTVVEQRATLRDAPFHYRTNEIRILTKKFIDITQRLLKMSTEVNSYTTTEVSPMDFAVLSQQIDLATLLYESGEKVTKRWVLNFRMDKSFEKKQIETLINLGKLTNHELIAVVASNRTDRTQKLVAVGWLNYKQSGEPVFGTILDLFLHRKIHEWHHYWLGSSELFNNLDKWYSQRPQGELAYATDKYIAFLDSETRNSERDPTYHLIAHRLLATIKGTDHITKNFTQIQSSIYELFERHPENTFLLMNLVKEIWIPKLQSVFESAPSNSELNQQIRAFFVSLKMMNPELFSNLQLKEAASPSLSGKVNVASAGKKACVPIIL